MKDDLNESWAEVEDFQGYYVSDAGSAMHNGVPLTPHIYNKYGHSQIRMYKNGRQYTKDLHRLVAEAFIPNPDNLPLVRHRNGDASDNRVDNLAWGTYAENTQDSIELGTFHYNYHDFTPDELSRSIETNRTPVRAINTETGAASVYYSQADAARRLGLSQGNICMVLTGRRNHTGGYRFEYVDKGGESDETY